MHRIPTLTTLSLCLAFAACGGGGGSSAPPPAPAEVAISSANQIAVARSVVSGGFALALAQPLAAPGRATSLAARTQPTALTPHTIAGVVQRVLELAAAQGSAVRAKPLAVSTETEVCSEGGSVATTYDDRDNNGDASAGDVLTAVFTQCKELGQIQIDGTVVLQVESVGANTVSALDLSGSLAFSKVKTRFGDTVATLDGSVAASVAIRSGTTTVTMTVGSDALRIGASSTGYSESVVYEPEMRMSVVDSDTDGSTSFTLDGSFTSESLGGRITVATLQPVRHPGTAYFPGSGQVLATGAAGSQLRLTVVDPTQVRLELDADGNGAFESKKLFPWDALAPH